MAKFGARRFCNECGFEMSASLWAKHTSGKVHLSAIKEGKWKKAEEEAAVLSADKHFVDVRVGWFEVAISKPTRRTEPALVVAKDVLGNTTILTTEGGFRQYLKGEVVSVRTIDSSRTEIVLKDGAIA